MIVATGGAEPALRRAQRNPWERSRIDVSAPAGRRKGAEVGCPPSPGRCLRPVGATTMLGEIRFHGFRDVEYAAAPPVATVRRPAGTDAGVAAQRTYLGQIDKVGATASLRTGGTRSSVPPSTCVSGMALVMCAGAPLERRPALRALRFVQALEIVPATHANRVAA